MDGRVSEGLPRPQDLPHHSSSAKPVHTGEELYLYVAVSPHAMSSALIREEGKIQKSVYYTSQALRGAKG